MYIFDKECPICGKEIEDIKEFIEHIKRHNEADPEIEKNIVKQIEDRTKQLF